MILDNGILHVVISEKGAEMVSLSKHGIQFLWNADANYWNRHAPILFPIVGKLRCKLPLFREGYIFREGYNLIWRHCANRSIRLALKHARYGNPCICSRSIKRLRPTLMALARTCSRREFVCLQGRVCQMTTSVISLTVFAGINKSNTFP